MTNWRWWLCSLLFVATTVNYLDRQVLSLTYEEFIKPDDEPMTYEVMDIINKLNTLAQR